MPFLRPRILIFGGTFDPPHRAHTTLPPAVASELECEHVMYVPNAANPLKDDAPTPAVHRLAMLRIALRDEPRAMVSTVEIDREGPSYTVDTLDELRRQLGDGKELALLIGADAALGFHRWHDWRRILELARPVVMLRPPWDKSAFAEALHRVRPDDDARFWLDRTVNVPLLNVSATDIRRRLASGEDVSGDLDPAVHEYIFEHGLYGTRGAQRG